MFVYKQYDQTALDRQYNTRLQVPEFAVHFQRWEDGSHAAKEKFNGIHDIAYGKAERERLDIYPSPVKKSKTLVFIHGGYWQKLDKSLFQFIAGAFVPYGITVVLITYPMAPLVPMDAIVDSCRRAIRWVQANIPAYNGDPDELYVAGHSAGGHLAVMMLCDGQHPGDTLPVGMIKGVCAMSGLYNLEPIRLSEINQVVQLDGQAAFRNSPVNVLPALPCPLRIAVGAEESPEFIAQSEALYIAWQKQAAPVEWSCLPAINHYSIIEHFADNSSSLHALMLELMK